MMENTWTRIQKKAILPFLYEKLQSAASLSSTYLCSVQERMCRVVDAMAFLSSWQITDAAELYQKLNNASSATRRFVGEHLCRFDLKVFHEMGQDIDKWPWQGGESWVLAAPLLLPQANDAVCPSVYRK